MDKIGVIAMVAWGFVLVISLIKKLVKLIREVTHKSTCKHVNKILMKTDYQDRYHLYGCVDCGEDVYEGMDEK